MSYTLVLSDVYRQVQTKKQALSKCDYVLHIGL